MSQSSWKFFLCLAALAILVGCGGGAADVGATAVSGTVTLDGQPVERASVSFTPKSAGGRAAAGLTDASGRFELTTVESGDGATPGSYSVTVSKTSGGSNAAPLVTSQDPASMSKEERATYMASLKEMQEAPTKITDLLPAKYKTAANSGLSAEVKEGGKNDFTFELTK